ncbi:MAG: UbiA-like polyprenyltransferase [Candidatus Hydrothermarchaeota archaeon]|nr:UbiA-like polyprenyltransferase [Candidatus Hydrothermarchaeota archaeon]
MNLKTLLRFIRFEHTIFSLTFAYAGAMLAYGGIIPLEKFFWITLALFGARSAAIVLADLVDREIDAKNPRTKDRFLPSGKVSVEEARSIIIMSYLLLFFSAYQLNFLCFILSPIPVLIALAYPYSKRYTSLVHILLGMNLAFAPFGGWIAITASIELPALILAAAVTFWVAGFDVIYSCQDIKFDRKFGLHSIPARFGVKNGLLISSLLHALTILLLLSVFFILELGMFYLTGVAVIAALLIYEHLIVGSQSLEKVPVAFFNINAAVSVSIFVFVALDLVI